MLQKCQEQKIQLNSNGLSKRKANLHKWLNKIIILLLLFSPKKVKIFFYRHGTRKRHFKIHRHNNNFSDISTDLKGALKASDDKGSISCKSSGSSYLRIGIVKGRVLIKFFYFRHPKLGFWVLEFQIMNRIATFGVVSSASQLETRPLIG